MRQAQRVNWMKRVSLMLAVALLATGAQLWAPSPATAANTTYYVSPDGNDSNNGTSPGTPWRTIGKVNATSFQPGDAILFEGGKTLVGTLEFTSDDNGSEANPIVVGSYGTGRATLQHGPSGFGVRIVSVTGLRFENLNVVGPGRTKDPVTGETLTPRPNNDPLYMSGIWIDNSQFIEVDAVEVRDFQRAGVNIVNSDDVTISNVYAHQNGFMGIGTDYRNIGVVKSETEEDDLFSRRILITNSQAVDNPGDYTAAFLHSGNGILLYGVKDSVVQYSEAAHNGYDMGYNEFTGGPVGIWIVEQTSNTIVQNNISHNNTASNGNDGGGFDLDGGVFDNIFQYNYSYDNFGPSFLLFEYAADPETALWDNNTIRYNIGENDGAGSGGANLVAGWNTKNALIYNNTFYNSNGRYNVSSVTYGPSRPAGYRFWNNIFYNTQGNRFAVNLTDTTSLFQGNNYYAENGTFSIDGYTSLAAWRATGQEMLGATPVGMNVNPALVNPGNGEALTDPTQLTSLNAYKLQSSSPMINAGLDLYTTFGVDPGERDFYGNALPQGGGFDIGAQEFAGTPEPSPEPVNLITNGSFEANTGAPSGWGRWSPNGAADEAASVVQNANALSGANALTISRNAPFSVYTYQTVTGLPNGTYTLKAWVKRQGLGVNVEVKDYTGSGGYVNTVLPAATTDYEQVTLSGIGVTGGQATIGFNVTSGTASANSILIDDVQFYNEDLSAPVLTGTSVSSLTATSGTLNFSSNEAGTYSYLVYEASASAPSAAVIEAQGTAITKGTGSALQGSNAIGLTGLSTATSYNAYVIVKDAAGNTSAVVTVPFVTSGPTNLLTNGGFEAGTGTPAGWTFWSGNGGENALNVQASDAFSGSNALSISKTTAAYNVMMWQTKTGLANGLYTLKVRVKSTGGFNQAYMEAADYGGSPLYAFIQTSSTYQELTIANIPVTNGQVKANFFIDTGSSINTGAIRLDDVELFLQ